MSRLALVLIAVAFCATAGIPLDLAVAAPPHAAAAAEMLAQPVTLSVHAAPLVRALKQLRAQSGATIVFDSKKLEREGYFPAALPSRKRLLEREGLRPLPLASLICRETPLDRALDLLLEPSRLTYEIRDDGAVWVLPDDDGDAAMRIRDYPVGDLLWKRPAVDEYVTGYDEIQSLLFATCSPQSWDDIGGPGRLAEKNGVLRILQSRHVHDEVAATLAEVRRVRAARPGHELLPRPRCSPPGFPPGRTAAWSWNVKPSRKRTWRSMRL